MVSSARKPSCRGFHLSAGPCLLVPSSQRRPAPRPSERSGYLEECATRSHLHSALRTREAFCHPSPWVIRETSGAASFHEYPKPSRSQTSATYCRRSVRSPSPCSQSLDLDPVARRAYLPNERCERRRSGACRHHPQTFLLPLAHWLVVGYSCRCEGSWHSKGEAGANAVRAARLVTSRNAWAWQASERQSAAAAAVCGLQASAVCW